MKSETINGKNITFHKRFKYVSRDFSAVPFVEARYSGSVIMIADTKEEIVKELKKKQK
jgi:hypothetical protein